MEVRDMKLVCRYRFLAAGYLLLTISSVLLFSCKSIEEEIDLVEEDETEEMFQDGDDGRG